jgi:hypothetical protein
MHEQEITIDSPDGVLLSKHLGSAVVRRIQQLSHIKLYKRSYGNSPYYLIDESFGADSQDRYGGSVFDCHFVEFVAKIKSHLDYWYYW